MANSKALCSSFVLLFTLLGFPHDVLTHNLPKVVSNSNRILYAADPLPPDEDDRDIYYNNFVNFQGTFSSNNKPSRKEQHEIDHHNDDVVQDQFPTTLNDIVKPSMLGRDHHSDATHHQLQGVKDIGVHLHEFQRAIPPWEDKRYQFTNAIDEKDIGGKNYKDGTYMTSHRKMMKPYEVKTGYDVAP